MQSKVNTGVEKNMEQRNTGLEAKMGELQIKNNQQVELSGDPRPSKKRRTEKNENEEPYYEETERIPSTKTRSGRKVYTGVR